MNSLDKRPRILVSPTRPIVPSLLMKVPHDGGTSHYLKVSTTEFETTITIDAGGPASSITLPIDEARRLIAMMGALVK